MVKRRKGAKIISSTLDTGLGDMSVSAITGLDLPKLPTIDKADIEAVRSFLPGKLLGRTAALLSLVLLVVAWVGGVDAGLKKLLIEPLKGLTALQTLNLSGTQVANIEPLKGLTALQNLYLLGTQVANIEPLKGLTKLQNLDLSQTQVANIDPLKGLTKLKIIWSPPPSAPH
jgi:Leucine-rich repeat (LRR) protein